MNKPAKVQEPSMEEILASIRRIIADDDVQKAQTASLSPKPAPFASGPTIASPPSPLVPPPSSVNLAPVFESGIGMEREGEVRIDARVDHLNAPVEKEPRIRTEPDILELTEEMAARPTAPEPSPAAQFEPPLSSGGYRHSAGNGASEPLIPRTVTHGTGGDRPLLSSTTSVAVDSAFNALSQTVLAQNSRSLEDLVREMLRPMLKAWLDDNLPAMVERLVRSEIERVSRGRG